MVVLKFTAARAFFQVLEDRHVTDAENAPGGAQRIAFPVAALQRRQIKLA
jgi:hypothetical protein